jgi:tetratricopeptide (TPR) repeat protein
MFWPFKKRTTWKEQFDLGMAAGGSGDIEGAVSHFRNAIRLAPLEPYPHYELGYSQFLLGRFEQALQEFRCTNELAEEFFLVQTEIYICEMVLAGVLDSECIAALRQIQLLTDTGQARGHDAVSLSRGLIVRAPTCASGYCYLGKALFTVDPKASEDALRQCLELRPDDTTAIDALTHIGSHRQAAGDSKGARAMWSDVVATYKSNPHVKTTEAFFLQSSA